MKEEMGTKEDPESLPGKPLAKRPRTLPGYRVRLIPRPVPPAAETTIKQDHSNVDSSHQQDKTDSSEVPVPSSQAKTRHAGQTRFASKFEVTKSSPEPEPDSKRQRILRARIPPALSKEFLRVTDRFSGPYLPDTEEGHYVFTIGDNLTPRYKIMRKFGEGTFGRVMECWDRRRSGYVAIKVIRAIEKYRDAAMIELQVLATLAANDPQRTYPVVRLLEWFDYRGHICMVFDRLGPSIYDCLRRNHYKGFPLSMARDFTRQVLHAVAYMHTFSLIHTDLKPENILFVNDELNVVSRPHGSKLASKLPSSTSVTLIDFGSATFNEDYHSSIVSTRHYRAPEIILGLGWSMPCDLWSLGCILVEFLTGEALFQTHDNLEHLAMMERIMGKIPSEMARAATASSSSQPVQDLFKARSHQLNWPEGAADKRSIRAVNKLKPLREHLLSSTDASMHAHVDLIVDLLKKLMAWDPSKRITAQEALQHPLFSTTHID